MKKIILLASILLLAGSARAQMVGGGGSIGLSASINPPDSSASNAGGVAAAPHPNVSATNPGEFVPSTFESYQQAVATGQEELDARPLRVAEVARIAQSRKKLQTQKPALIAEQDNDGNVVVSSGKQPTRDKSN